MNIKIVALLSFYLSFGVEAFWPPSNESRFDEFTYKECQVFNSIKESSTYTYSIRNCESPEDLRSLGVLANSISDIELEIQEQNVLNEIKDFIENKAQEGLDLFDKQKACLKKKIEDLEVSENCEGVIRYLRSSTSLTLPEMRKQMALMSAPKNQRRSRANLNPGEVVSLKKDIEHFYSSVEIPPLNETEKEELLERHKAMVHEIKQSWMKHRPEHSCVIKQKGVHQLKNSSCKMIVNDAVRLNVDKMTKQSELNYRKMLVTNPLLAYMNISQRPKDEKEFDKALLEGLERMHEAIKEDLSDLVFNDKEDLENFFAYPSLVEKFIAQNNPVSFNQCMAIESLHEGHGPGNLSGIMKDIGIGLATLAGGAACIFTGGLACAVGVAVLSEGYFLGSSQMEYLESRSLFNAQLVVPEEMDQRMNERDVSVLLAPLSFVGLHSAQSLNRTRIGLNPTPLRQDIESLIAFKTELLDYSPTTTRQNLEWIATAKSGKANLFLDIENAAIKRLNDQLGDKNLVTALTNLHKKILDEELNLVFSKYSGLDVKRYSDFKSMRFAVRGEIPPSFEIELSQALEQTASRFKAEGKWRLQGSLLSEEDSARWFSAGIGQTADQAGVAARQARKMVENRDEVTRGVRFTRVRAQLLKALSETESIRVNAINVVRKYGPQAFRLIGSDKPVVFNEHFFEVMRKSAAGELHELRAALKRNFNIEFSDAEVRELKKYYNKVDDFSPGVWVEKRTLANLDNAKAGGFSADFKGMGAKNLEQVAKDLANNPNDLDEALEAIREGEKSVTEIFNQNKQNYRETVEGTLKRFNIKVDQACSGDDCVSMVASPLTQEQVL